MKTKTLISAILLFSATIASAQTFNLGANVQGIKEGETLIIFGTGDMYNYNSSSTPNFGNITEVIIEKGITSIGDRVFYNCSGLISVTMPNSVATIGRAAFYQCSALTTVFIPNSVTSIGEFAFFKCGNLASVTIPNSVKSIGDSAFYGCNNLTSVVIPKSVDIIIEAFDDCSKATLYCECEETSKPTGWSSNWNAQTKWGCKVIRAISNNAEYGNVTIEGKNYAVKGDDGSLWYLAETVNETVNLIATAKEGGSFIKWEDDANAGSKRYYVGVKSKTYKAIFAQAFIINGLKYTVIDEENHYVSVSKGATDPSGALVIPSIVKNGNITYTVTSIGSFSDCRHDIITSLIIPNTITSIDSYAFYYCNALNSALIFIPKSVTSIGGMAFTYIGMPTLYCESTEKPIGWSGGWNYTDCAEDHTPVEWGCKIIGLSVSNGEYGNANVTGYAAKINDDSLLYLNNAQVTLTAAPQNGYHVVWENNSTENTRTFSATESKTYTATFDAHIEAIKFENINSATCTTVGTYDSVVYCSVCQAELFREEKEIPALGHTADSVEFENIVPATCTAAGTKDSVVFCSVCQVELSREEHGIPALGHTPDSIEFENIIPATCTVAGSKDSVVYCSVCQVELSREEKETPALGHTYSNTVTAPTCTAVGFTTHTCSVCEFTYNSDTVAANGHTEVTDVALAATCTAAGKTEGKHCSVCNEIIMAQTEIPALGHEFKDYVYNNDATTTADGTETATCTRGCGATDTRPAAGTKLAETPEKGTAVSDAAANAVTIYAHHNTIVVENATDEICVYNAMGALIRRDATPCVRAEITVNGTGVYIVKTSSVVKRVAVE